MLASWAVPKGIPLEAGVRALAVHVEDHPLDYASFEGEIPKGQYGAGSVEIWDRGTYELLEEKPDGGLTVRLHGRRLDGTWTLVPAKLGGDPENWLLFRSGHSAARNDYRAMLASLAESSLQAATGYSSRNGTATGRSGTSGMERRGLSRATGTTSPSASRSWRRRSSKAMRTPDCVVDGEVCALDAEGRPSFSAMQQGAPSLVYEVFDLLELDGVPLVDLPLSERRGRLEAVLGPSASVQLSGVFDDGEALLEAASAQSLEGVMAKRAGSRYAEGRRTRDWLKVKTHAEQEFVVCGWTKGRGRREGRFGALVLGVTRGGELHWVGNCGTGFTDATIEELLRKLEPLRAAAAPFPVVPKMPKVAKGDVVWVEPRLVCEVEFAEWTHDGHLRAPSFKGLRDDKPARDVRRENPVDMESGRVKLSNLDKVFWPDEEITKGDLLEYYRAVAPVLVPHLRNRPFTMRRYPDGAFGKAFFQKDAPSHMPDWIPTFRVQVSTRQSPPQKRWIEAPLVNEEDALLWMANMGCIDMNAWYSRVDRPDRPDFVLFDLDPSDDVGFARDRAGGAAREGHARHARARVVPEDERRRRHPRPRAGRAAPHV